MVHPAIIILGLFASMLGLLEVGRRVAGGRKLAGLNTVEGAVFGLMGLLIAFTFGSAAVRFETRRNLIVEEANCIRTAYLRLEVLPETARPALRDAFRSYVDTRLATYRSVPNSEAVKPHLATMAELQKQIWETSVMTCGQGGPPAACALLLTALNNMFDIAAKRIVARQTHQPGIVFVMLAMVMLACALLAGFSMSVSERSWLHMICFALALAMAYYVILDLEYPRIGLIRIDWMDGVLEDVRNGMGASGT